MKLNDDQLRAVESEKHCLVVACPGSGKTRLITTKVGVILQRCHHARIMAVTFTREAATELSRRMIGEIGQRRFDDRCRVGTFHALAIRHLTLNKIKHRLVSPSVQFGLLRRAIADACPELTVEAATAILDKAKGSLEPCDEHESPLYKTYQEMLARHRCIDLFDVIRLSTEGMRKGSIPPYPVSDMLIDEFQDTDNLQLQWVLEHAKAGTTVTVVGDDDQSIYSWRGANGYRGMQAFAQSVGAEIITLGTNYRCRAEILGAAAKLIARSASRIEKALHAERGNGGRVTVVRTATQDTEAEDVLAAIAPMLRKPERPGCLFAYTVPDGSWAVLARTRRQLDLIETHLLGEGIEVYRPPKESFWSREPQCGMLHLLEAISGHATTGLETSLDYAARVHFGNARARLIMEAVRKACGNDFSRMFIGDGLPDAKSAMDAERTLVSDFLTRLASWRSLAGSGRTNLAILGVAKWFADLEVGERQKGALNAGAATLCKLKGSLAERARVIAGIGPPTSRNKNVDSDRVTSSEATEAPAPTGVQLQTMHGSKGLEFENVWIVGADAKTIPSQKATDYEEERRLMYVAMTRAKDRLWISSTVGNPPSAFIADAGLTRLR